MPHFNTKHGHASTGARSAEYRSWMSMLERCYREKHPRYKDYGGRGVRVCARWRHSFINFFKDMGKRPSLKHTLDRKNSTDNYTPNNCKWSTPREQARNRRNSVYLTVDGEKLLLTEWSELSGTKYTTIRERLKRGYSHKEAVFGKAVA